MDTNWSMVDWGGIFYSPKEMWGITCGGFKIHL